MELAPSEIFYCQDSIRPTFRAGGHRGKYIGETLDDIVEGKTYVKNIAIISVFEKDDKWFTLDNRRLWVFRHLDKLGLCSKVQVKLGSFCARKFTTNNGGEDIDVRGDPQGSWHKKTRSQLPKNLITPRPSSSVSLDTLISPGIAYNQCNPVPSATGSSIVDVKVPDKPGDVGEAKEPAQEEQQQKSFTPVAFNDGCSDTIKECDDNRGERSEERKGDDNRDSDSIKDQSDWDSYTDEGTDDESNNEWDEETDDESDMGWGVEDMEDDLDMYWRSGYEEETCSVTTDREEEMDGETDDDGSSVFNWSTAYEEESSSEEEVDDEFNDVDINDLYSRIAWEMESGSDSDDYEQPCS